MGFVGNALISLVDLLWRFIQILHIQLTWTHHTAVAVLIVWFNSKIRSLWAFLRSYVVAWDSLNITLSIICYILLHELIIIDCNQVAAGSTHVSLVFVLIRAQKHVIATLSRCATGIIFWFTRIISLLAAGIMIMNSWKLLWKVFIANLILVYLIKLHINFLHVLRSSQVLQNAIYVGILLILGSAGASTRK